MYLVVVRTARLFGAASATAAGSFFRGLGRFRRRLCLGCRLFLGLFLQFLFRERGLSRVASLLLPGLHRRILGVAARRGLFCCLSGTPGAGFHRCTSAAASATCAGFPGSAAVACRMGAGQGNTPRTDQTGDPETGKEFFQILAIHRFSPSLRL